MKIYVASSWRNTLQPAVVAALRAQDHEVYDFKCPPGVERGFSWADVDPNWQKWTNEQYVQGLGTDKASEGFRRDMKALREADAVVLVLPAGKSSHLELGWAAGANKHTVILLPEGGQEAELMYGMAHFVTGKFEELLRHFDWLKHHRAAHQQAAAQQATVANSAFESPLGRMPDVRSAGDIEDALAYLETSLAGAKRVGLPPQFIQTTEMMISALQWVLFRESAGSDQFDEIVKQLRAVREVEKKAAAGTITQEQASAEILKMANARLKKHGIQVAPGPRVG